MTVLVVGIEFLNRTEACFEPAANGSLSPQLRIDGDACASRMCDQVARERAGGIRSERTASGRRDQEHVEPAYVDGLPEPGLEVSDGFAVGLHDVGVNVRPPETRRHFVFRECAAIPETHYVRVEMPPNEHLDVVQRCGTNDDVVAVERRWRDAVTDSHRTRTLGNVHRSAHRSGWRQTDVRSPGQCKTSGAGRFSQIVNAGRGVIPALR